MNTEDSKSQPELQGPKNTRQLMSGLQEAGPASALGLVALTHGHSTVLSSKAQPTPGVENLGSLKLLAQVMSTLPAPDLVHLPCSTPSSGLDLL